MWTRLCFLQGYVISFKECMVVSSCCYWRPGFTLNGFNLGSRSAIPSALSHVRTIRISIPQSDVLSISKAFGRNVTDAPVDGPTIVL
jgi:hypothetical protein